MYSIIQHAGEMNITLVV